MLEDLEALNPVRLKGVAIASYNTEGLAIDYPGTRRAERGDDESLGAAFRCSILCCSTR